MNTVALVLDRQFGQRLFGLAQQMPVWVVSSRENAAAATRARAALGASADITELLPRDLEMPGELLARGLYDIDQHHGMGSGEPLSSVIVYGADPDELAGELISELGFRVTRRANTAFCVER